MQGKLCLVTGASSGIGRATAEGLARLGARVVLVCRHRRRGERARRRIERRTGSRDLELLFADLSSQRSIRRFAAEFQGKHAKLDVLVNNAGLLTRRRRLTGDGLELQFAVNHLGAFMVTQLLFPALRAASRSRIVNVASTAQSRGVIDLDDLQGERGYRGWQTYANTKLANVLFTYELARRIEGTGVTANCLHPGVIHTGLLRRYSSALNLLFHLLAPFFRGPEEGARTPVYVASSPELEGVSGRYFMKCKEARTSRASYDVDLARKLWEASETLTGVSEI
jgi:NAD(P)-dependent dehydrogenase (short-subunit alcohol dehydrogenase family)